MKPHSSLEIMGKVFNSTYYNQIGQINVRQTIRYWVTEVNTYP